HRGARPASAGAGRPGVVRSDAVAANPDPRRIRTPDQDALERVPGDDVPGGERGATDLGSGRIVDVDAGAQIRHSGPAGRVRPDAVAKDRVARGGRLGDV